MKHLLTTILASTSLLGWSQGYHDDGSLGTGNPRNLHDTYEEITTGAGGGGYAGWTAVMGTQASPTWSSAQSLPWSFTFNGSPVSSYKVSSSGIVTFTASPGAAPSSTSASLPNATIPDNSICIWGLAGTGTNDAIVSKTFGTAPERQHWIAFSSYSAGTGAANYTYWSIVLDEKCNNIYIVDCKSVTTGALNLSMGIQINSGTAYTHSLAPTQPNGNSGSYGADNKFYTFAPGITPPALDMAGVSVDLDYWLERPTGPFTVTGKLKNAGTSTITAMDIHYKIGSGSPVSQSLTGLNITAGSTYNVSHGTQWSPATVGKHTIELWADNLNGSSDARTCNDKTSGTVDTYDASTTRHPLLETFTSSTCSPCTPGNTNIEGILNQGTNAEDIISIKYQMSWPTVSGKVGDPYYTLVGGTKRSLYGVNSVPATFIDGALGINSNSITASHFTDAKDVPAFCDLAATLTIEDMTVSVDVNVDPVESRSGGSLKLFVGIFEYETNQNIGTNGETKFYHVMKKMMPDANGSSLASLAVGVPQTKSLSYEFKGEFRLPSDSNTPINHSSEHSVEEFSDLGAVVWIQDNLTKEVYQAAYATVTDITGLSENREMLSMVKVYPNPVSNVATIAINSMAAGDISYELYNMLGDKVAAEEFGKVAAGRNLFTLDVSGQVSGIYMLHVVSGQDRIVNKMNVVN